MSAKVLDFPVQIRIEDFMADAALRQQIRQCAGAIAGVYHDHPSADETLFALTKVEEMIVLMRSYTALKTHG